MSKWIAEFDLEDGDAMPEHIMEMNYMGAKIDFHCRPMWTPVSKELPKKSGRYIVTALDGINRRTTVVQYQSRYKTWTMAGRRAYWKVIAWGPLLPEPYKTESETKQGLNYADQDTLMPAT